MRANLSCRKFDPHGDWHFLKAAFLVPLFSVIATRRFEAIVKRYWYEGR